jgi:hypothetical protein
MIVIETLLMDGVRFGLWSMIANSEANDSIIALLNQSIANHVAWTTK